jgi:hypothetical protein
MGKMRVMTPELGTVMFSDGLTTVNHHPIVNINMGVRSLYTLRSSIDTMGQEKTMDFITDLVLEYIWDVEGYFCPYPAKMSLDVVFEVGTPSPI